MGAITILLALGVAVFLYWFIESMVGEAGNEVRETEIIDISWQKPRRDFVAYK